MFQEFNPNPVANRTGDCVVRAIAKALNVSWEKAYVMLALNGFLMGDLPNSNAVWAALLRQNGFKARTLPDECPDCYTAEDFCEDHPNGTFVLGFGNHVAAIVDGTLYDSWNSTQETPILYWYKEAKQDGV